MGVPKLSKISITDQIYQVLIQKITSGEWKTGEKIPSEIDLAEQLGVSRPSLKMALQKLNTLGVTETRVGEGTFVCSFNMKNYFEELMSSNLLVMNERQLNEFRILLEGNVMRLAILNSEKEGDDWKPLETILDYMVGYLNRKDIDNYHKYHFQFHEYICKMSHNQLFILLYDALNTILYDIYKSNSEKSWKNEGIQESIQHHTRILKALRTKDIQDCMKLQDELFSYEMAHSVNG